MDGRRYEDDDRRFAEPAPRERDDEGRRYRGEGYYGGYYGDRGGWERRERGFLDRVADELRSWFGDQDAEQRRREDERLAQRRGRPESRRSERSWEPDDRTWGHADEPYARGATAEGRDDRWVARDRGPYAGRGPKGYRRSDERIREDVCDLLCEHGALDASNVEVQVVAAEVTLLGFIPTRSQKRLAEDLAESVSGVSDVHNQLRVNAPETAAPAPPPPESATPPRDDWRNRAA